MLVKNYMLRQVHKVSPSDTVAYALEVMISKKTNGLIVIDEISSEIVWTVSSLSLAKTIIPDFLKKDPHNSIYEVEWSFDEYIRKSASLKVKDVMYKDFHLLTEEDAMIQAAAFSTHWDQRIMPVVKKWTKKIIWVITRTSVKNACYDVINNKK